MSHRIPGTQLVAALATLGAAVVHFVVAADHWSAWWGYGVQFIAAALIQLGWGLAALVRHSRPLLGTGVALQGVFVVAWAVTRTLGQPIGPAAGTVEPVGSPGALTVLLELTAIVGALLVLITGAAPTPARSRYIAGVGTGGVVVLAATSVAVLTAMSGGHHGGGGHHGDSHHDKPAQQEPGTGHHEPAVPTSPTESSSSAPSPEPSPESGDGHNHHHG